MQPLPLFWKRWRSTTRSKWPNSMVGWCAPPAARSIHIPHLSIPRQLAAQPIDLEIVRFWLNSSERIAPSDISYRMRVALRAGSFRKEISMSDSVRFGLWVPLHAKPGKEAAVESFLRSGLGLVEQEPKTTAWFALRLGPSTFGIFDVFPDEAGRDAHLNGAVAKALMENAADLLSEPPKINKLEVIAAKLPSQRAEKAA